MKFGRLPARAAVLAAAFLIGLAGFIALLYRVSSPQLLMPEGGAHWVISPNPPNLAASGPQLRASEFHTVLTISVPPRGAIAQLRSLGHAELFINGRLAAQSQGWHGWQETASLDIAPYLHDGENEIAVLARHAWGPSAILLFCDAIDLSGVDWQVRVEGQHWNTAKLATGTESRPPHMMQWTGAAALATHSGALAVFAALGTAVALALRRQRAGTTLLVVWQWIVMAALVALHAWNFARIPPMLGMDMSQHVEYVVHILQERALPFADQGWQMFQPPLAYLAGALVVPLSSWIAPGLGPIDSLRLLPLACSLATAWVACRICVLAFDRAGTAAVAMLVAAFLPASLYMAQAFGNEPFAALFGTLLVYEAVRLLKAPRVEKKAGRQLEGSRIQNWVLVRTGLWLGLGLLSKPTILLLLPAVLAVVVWHGRGKAVWAASLRAVSAILALGLSISGWWYVRNMLHFGRPFVGGWEPGRGQDWWQYPGYRVPEHWLRFGEALIRPYFSGLDSFWDGIYSTLWLDGYLSGQIQAEFGPPWNLSVMAALGLLSLPVLAAIVWGFLRAAFYPRRELERGLALFAGANLIIFLVVMALVYGQVPAYSAGKGTYLLSALGCLPILTGLGIDWIIERPVGRVVLSAFSAVWLGFVVLAFLVR